MICVTNLNFQRSHQSSGNPGFFDSESGTYVLVDEPPRKWRNIHYNKPGATEIYAECSNIGDGPITIRDQKGNTCDLIGYDAKYLYLRDEGTGQCFTPWGDPLATRVEAKRCIFHAAYTQALCEFEGLRVSRTTFVPADEDCEVWIVTVENRSDVSRHVSLFAYAMFQLTGKTSAGDPVWKDNSSRVLPEVGGVFVENRDRSVPVWRFNGFLITTSDGYRGASGYRDYFTRESYSLGDPKILYGWNADNRPGQGPDCAGVVQVRLDLAAGACGRADFILGRAQDEAEVAALRQRLTPSAIDAALAAQIETENKRSAAFRVDTGYPDRDALINFFVKKQMVSYLINKSGFRDNLQNDMGVAMFDWPMARENLCRAIASQCFNGSVPHSFRPWNRKQYSDKPAWLLHCVPWCIKESGELGFLETRLPYSDEPREETVWQHMLRAMRFLVKDTGRNGLCDQHFADWNDGLEPSEKTGKRESVMVSQQLCLGLLEMRELALRRGEGDVVSECEMWYAHFKKLLNEVAWDGAWYVRTLCEGGYTLGSSANAEGKIFMNTQSWAVLSRTAEGDRARLCMDSVDRLIEVEIGFPISAPPFTAFDERIGKFSASRPYYAENGGCYNHAAGFKGMADCLLGRAEEAWRTFVKVAPGSPWNPVSNSGAEPFSFTNCYSLIPEHRGRAMYPWRTGTCSWMTMLLVEGILGARRHYDGLEISPCMPKELKMAHLVRTYRGALFRIKLDNRDGRGVGARSIILNGQAVEGNILPDFRSGEHQVEVFV